MTRRRLLLLLLAVPLTAVAYLFVLVVTAVAACGISGCGGGGFGPAYMPVGAQIGLVAAGLVLLPLVLLGLRRWPLPVRLATGTAAALAGAVLAMTLLDLRPDGCPTGTTRATAGSGAFSPGTPTCISDRDTAR